MASGLEMYRALREKTKGLPAGSVVKINVHDSRDLCKLTADELVEVGFDEVVAKRVRSDLLAGSVTELGKALSLDLVISFLVKESGARRSS